MAICVELVPASAVGAKGVPVRVGLVVLILASKAACVNVDIGLSVSEVLSAFPRPTIDLDIPEAVPLTFKFVTFISS